MIDSVQEQFLIKQHESPGALMVSVVQTPQAQALTPHSQTHYRKPILNLHKHTHMQAYVSKVYCNLTAIETNHHSRINEGIYDS